jgi:hypothetical protein
MYRGAWSLALLLVTCTNAQLSGNGSPNLNPLDINSLLTAQINGEEMPVKPPPSSRLPEHAAPNVLLHGVAKLLRPRSHWAMLSL